MFSIRKLNHILQVCSQYQSVTQSLGNVQAILTASQLLLFTVDQVEEANGTTLLDNTIFTLGAGMGDGTTHQYNDLPLVVAGGGSANLRQGAHIHCPRGTPLANLWLTQLRALGIKRDRYADSTGTVSEIQV